MDAAAALAELEELAPGLRAAVLLDGAGTVEATTLSRPAPFASTVRELLAAADGLRRGRVARLHVETAEGGVFAVRAGALTLAAVTAPGAAAGLMLHDLEACLGRLEREVAGAAR